MESERKTDPPSSAKCSRKGLKDNNNRQLGVVNRFCIPFGTEIKISICGDLDSHCTKVTLHRVANFRAKHLNSNFEQTRRVVILLILLFILPVFILSYRFSMKNIVETRVFRVKKVISCSPHKSHFFEISTFFEKTKSAKLVCYIVAALL